MIDSKRLTLFAAVSVAAAVLICVLLAALAGSPAAETFSVSSEPLYAEKIFGADIITIDINADEAEWQHMLDNAMSEQYIMVDMAVNGTKFSNVGIRPKGNNSLQQVASSDSDRYSFKIKFDEYAEGQTCFGLDMLVLNDMLGDATYMKEYTAFDMMREMGIETPYFGYAMITLNGEDWGLYFALEAYNDSYKQRVSGDESGNLYNVKSSSGGFGNEEHNTDMENPPEQRDKNLSENSENFQDRGFGRGGMGGMGSMGASTSGGSLVCTDGESSSYSAIFGNAVGNSSDEEDYQKVIAALKALNEGENIEDYFDVDEILRYLAVHTVVVNLDSYSSGMAQNYYIYEHDGVLQILPWDYNYAWGAFQSGSSSAVVNFPIDTPVSGVEMSERPLIAKLFENEEYFDLYHKYLSGLMEKYFEGGSFDKKINELNTLIGGYVQKDPTAFFSYDEYLTALAAFKNIGKLRAESILGQLDGTVPSTTAGQQASPDKLIDASSVKLSELGSGGFGGGDDRGGSGNFGGFGKFGKAENSESQSGDFGVNNGKFKFDESGDFPEPNGGKFPKDFGGNVADRPEQQGQPMQPPDGNQFDGNPPGRNFWDGESFERGAENSRPDGHAPDGENRGAGTSSAVTAAVCLGVLIAAIFGASLVKRNF